MARKSDSLKSELDAQAEAAEAAQVEALRVDVCDDEHRGIGGCFIYDPVTKTRKRVVGTAVQLASGKISEPDAVGVANADTQGE